MKQTIKWKWIYLILVIFSMATFSCSCSENRTATFTGKLIDKRYDLQHDRYIVLINESDLNKIIKVYTTADVYYKSSLGSTLSFTLSERSLWLNGNGTEESTQMMDRKVLKPAKEYLKKQ